MPRQLFSKPDHDAQAIESPDKTRRRAALDCRRLAMDYQARREHSRSELFRKLVTRGCEEPVVEQTLASLEQEGLIDQRRFAEAFVASRARRGQGPVRIRAELRQREIDDMLVTACLDNGGIDWTERAVAVRIKKFGGELPGDFETRARQSRFLEYRGFDHEHIRAAMRNDPRADGNES